MDDVRMVYSEERGTWNVIVNGEWYYEDARYDKAEAVFNTFFWQDDEQDYEEAY